MSAQSSHAAGKSHIQQGFHLNQLYISEEYDQQAEITQEFEIISIYLEQTHLHSFCFILKRIGYTRFATVAVPPQSSSLPTSYAAQAGA